METIDLAVVTQVAEEKAADEAAALQVRAVEVMLLAVVVEKVKPALRALATRPRTAYTHWNSDRADEDTHAQWAGLLVSGDGKPQCDGGRDDNAGELSGQGLYLLADGTWRTLDYAGNWTRWDKACAQMTTKCDTWTLDEVVGAFDVDEIVAAIAKALAAQVGKRVDGTKAKLARAEKLAALATMMR